MKNKTRRLAAFLLSAAVVITAVPEMQERVYPKKPADTQSHPKVKMFRWYKKQNPG